MALLDIAFLILGKLKTQKIIMPNVKKPVIGEFFAHNWFFLSYIRR